MYCVLPLLWHNNNIIVCSPFLPSLKLTHNQKNRERQINEEDEATGNSAIELEAYRKPREVALKQNQAFYTSERRRESKCMVQSTQ